MEGPGAPVVAIVGQEIVLSCELSEDTDSTWNVIWYLDRPDGPLPRTEISYNKKIYNHHMKDYVFAGEGDFDYSIKIRNVSVTETRLQCEVLNRILSPQYTSEWSNLSIVGECRGGYRMILVHEYVQ